MGTVIKALSWVVFFALVGLAFLRDHTDITQYDGVIAPNDPVQRNLPRKQSVMSKGEWKVSALAQYDITARVLGRKDYTFDKTSDISPMDLALGWGLMSDNRILDDITIRQNDRWYFVESTSTELSIRDIMQNSANTHIIPHDERVASVLDIVKKGHVVELSGYLVECLSETLDPWKSSLVRNDTGDEACEILVVKSVKVYGTPAREGAELKLVASATSRNEASRNSDEALINNVQNRRFDTRARRSTEERPSPSTSATTANATDSFATTPRPTVAREPVSILNGQSIPEFLEDAVITGIGKRGAVINGRFCRVNHVLDYATGLKLVRVENDILHFVDNAGTPYNKAFR